MKAFKRFLSALLVIVTLMGTLPAVAQTAAAATTITSNYALDHMEYLGYKIKTQISSGNLFGSDDYSFTVQGSKTRNTAAGEWISNLDWDDTDIVYGGNDSITTGLEMVEETAVLGSGTPNLAYWRKSSEDGYRTRGLVCASYTASFYMNYLPNIKKGFSEEDGGKGFVNMANAMIAAISNYGNIQSAINWGKGIDDLAAQFEADPNLTYDGYRVVEYVYDEIEEAYENMVPGDLVLFYDKDGNCIHTSIYLGEGGSISDYGFASYSPNGKMHWISNIVEAGIGPDVLEVYIKSYIAEDGDVDTSVDPDKCGVPTFYHFEYVGEDPDVGSVTISKTASPTTAQSYGWNFLVTDPDGNEVGTYRTGSDGTVTISDLEPGKYTVKEIPDTIVINSVVASGTVSSGSTAKVTVNATGSGLTYQWYYRSSSTASWSKSSITTNEYTVEMTSARDGRQVYCKITDSNGNTASSDITTLHVSSGNPKITKLTATPTGLHGDTVSATVAASGSGLSYVWYYRKAGATKWSKSSVTTATYDMALNASRDNREVYCLVTDSSGNTVSSDIVTFKVVHDADYWTCTDSDLTKTVTVVTDTTKTVSFTNNHYGKVKFIKSTNTGANLSGWTITLYSDSSCTTKVGSYTTGSDGTITTGNLTPGTYYAKETASSSSYWECDTAVKTVKVTAGSTTSVTFTNNHYGKVKFVKNTNTGANLSGWVITLYSDSSCTTKVGSYTTGSDGTITTGNLTPGTYYAKETASSSSYWECDTAVKTVKVTAGSTTSVTFTNTHYGALQINKSTNTGENYGWNFKVTDSNGNIVGTYSTNSSGVITVPDLLPGTYTVTEIEDELVILGESINTRAASGEAVSVVLDVKGEGLNYTWYYKNSGSSKFTHTTTFDGSTTYHTTMNSSRDGRQFYCVITDENGNSVISRTYTFEMTSDFPTINGITAVTAAENGDSISVVIDAEGDGLTYKWYYKNAGKSSFSTTSTFTGNTYATTMREDRDGRQVYCIITDADGNTYTSPTFTFQMFHNTDYWAATTLSKSVTVKAGATASTTFVNTYTAPNATIGVLKTDDAGTPLEGAVFGVYADAACSDLVGTITTDANGTASLSNLDDGNTYYVKEISAPEGYILSSAVYSATVANDTTTYINGGNPVVNTRVSKIKIIKSDDLGTILGAGYQFGIYSDASCSTLVQTITTNSEGVAESDYLTPNTYYVKELAVGDSNHNINTNRITVVATAGKTVTVNFVNEIKKGAIAVLKTDDAGTPMQGVEFTVFSDDGMSVIGIITTDENGEAVMETLPHGFTYYVQETSTPEGYVLDTTVYPVTVVGDETTYVNGGAPVINYRLVALTINKVNTWDEPLDGVTFLLEWSEDGGNWEAVFSTDKLSPVYGGCSSEGLSDGCLTTGADGTITFEGLYPGLMYRLTELETQDGYLLLTDYAFEGTLTYDTAPELLTVVNCPAYALPASGVDADYTIATIATFGAVLLLTIVTVITFGGKPVSRRKKSSGENH